MTRQTFENAYREMIRKSDVYKLKFCRPGAGYLDTLNASCNDVDELHKFLDGLCDDMSFVLGCRIKRVTHVGFRVSPFGKQYVAAFLDEYTAKLPGVIQKVISGLVRKQPPYMLRTGWVKWSGWDATTQFPNGRGAAKEINFYEAEEVSPDTFVLPEHLTHLLKRLKQTKYDYQPYILSGSNGEKVLAIKLGCQWSDLVIAHWDEESPKSELRKQLAATFASFLVFMLSMIGVISGRSLIIVVLCIFLAIISLLSSMFMSMLVSDYYRPIRI